MATVRIPVEFSNSTFPSPIINVWHARVETAGDLWDGGVQPYSGVLGALWTFYNDLKSFVPAGVKISVPSAVVDVTTAEELSADPLPVIDATGTGTAPRGLAMCINWKTEIRARRGTGRTFFGPLASSILDSADGTPVASALGNLEARCADLVAASSAVNGWGLGVRGQAQANVPGTYVLRDITGFKINDKFAHLRTRRD